MIIRKSVPSDFKEILKLNKEFVHFLSPLNEKELVNLDSKSDLSITIEDNGKLLGFLIAFREGRNYESVNYKWFTENYEKFLYIDRVVISKDAQGKKIGSLLYRYVLNEAKNMNVKAVVAEYYTKPFNEVSEKFHSKFGFAEVGKQVLPNSEKEVSMQAVFCNK